MFSEKLIFIQHFVTPLLNQTNLCIFWGVYRNLRVKNQTFFSLSKNLKVLKWTLKNLPKHASVIVGKKVVSAFAQQVFD